MNRDSEGANMEGHENPENGKLYCGALHAQLYILFHNSFSTQKYLDI